MTCNSKCKVYVNKFTLFSITEKYIPIMVIMCETLNSFLKWMELMLMTLYAYSPSLLSSFILYEFFQISKRQIVEWNLTMQWQINFIEGNNLIIIHL